MRVVREGLALVAIALFPTTIVAEALRAPMIGEMGFDPFEYTTLYIYLHTAPPANDTLCVPQVYVEVTGPFGHRESNVFNGTTTYVTVGLAKKDFPAGQQYQIGVGAPNLCSSEYTPFTKVNVTATGGDQYFAY